MINPSVVTIIPLYNGTRWIEQSIRSVFAQTLQPDEFIVVDDGSTDDGPMIVEKLAQERPIIRLLRKPNGGQASARNFGIRHSTSDLVALLDQDDIWYPQHLERLLVPFGHSDALGWVYSDLDVVNEDGKVTFGNRLRSLPMEQPKRTLMRCLGEDMHILPSACLISRAAFDHVGGFDERLQGYEDDDLFLRMFVAGYHNEFIHEALSQWRMVASSSGHSPRMLASALTYMEKMLDAHPEGRDAIVDRFERTLTIFWERGLRAKDWEHCWKVADGLKRIAAIRKPSPMDYKTGICHAGLGRRQWR